MNAETRAWHNGPSRRTLWPIIGVVAAIVLVCCGGAFALIGARNTTTPHVATSPATTVQAVAERSAAPVAPAQSAKPAPPAAAVIEDGMWTVGVDVAPGTYRTNDTVVSGCYWAIYKSGTNGEDIIANDDPSGGRPQVTVKKGQDFKSQDCGPWTKLP